MGIFGDLFRAIGDAAEAASDPEKAGRERARHEYEHSSPSRMVDGIVTNDRLAAKHRKRAEKNPGDWGADWDVRWRQSQKEEIKKMLDEKLSCGDEKED